MSRVYWHSPSGEVELRGSERAWLGSLVKRMAGAAWDLDGPRSMDRAVEIAAMIPEVADGEYGANYVHTFMREAQAEGVANKRIYEAWKPGTPLPANTAHGYERRFVEALRTKLNLGEGRLRVAGVDLGIDNVSLNTAIAAGSDAVCLAAKIHGWCESHCWVDGPDREWLASIIDGGLESGLFRRGIWYVDRPCEGPASEQPDRKWSSQGWEEVATYLRARTDEPVVMSYSVCDQFPNSDVAGWEPPPMPEGWVPGWAEESAEGRAEWERDYPTEDLRAEYYRDTAHDLWYEVPTAEQWEMGMAGLRGSPWLQLTPESLRGVMFHLPVTVYDLFAPDRDERIRAAAGLATEPETATP